MKLLCTSDWHLGNRLMERSRHGEFAAFLEWLLDVMQQQGAEALLVSGDIFDNRDPGAPALEAFSQFLSRADSTGCRRVIMTAGNHDGVPVLEAMQPLLNRYGADLVYRLTVDTAADCLLPLCGADGEVAALVCAVPFLRPAEVARRCSAGESAQAYTLGVQDVLAAVAEHARAWRAAHPGKPVICMAHMSVNGAEPTASTEQVYIGGVEILPEGVFDSVFDYVALGHIHRGYSLSDKRLRYSGSPLPMGVDEAAYPHHVLLVDVTAQGVSVQPIEVPVFTCYAAEHCATDEQLAALPQKLQQLSAAHGGAPVYLQLHYTGSGVTDLGAWVSENLPATLVPHCRLSQYRPGSGVHELTDPALDTLPTVQEVFERKLAAWQQAGEPLSDEQLATLRSLFATAYREADHED